MHADAYREGQFGVFSINFDTRSLNAHGLAVDRHADIQAVLDEAADRIHKLMEEEHANRRSSRD